jgi:hypothetical protein
MHNQIEKYMHLLHNGPYLELNVKIDPERNVAAGILMIKYDRNLTEYHPIDMSDIGIEYLNDIQKRGVVVYNQDEAIQITRNHTWIA